jgi:Cytochrome P450
MNNTIPVDLEWKESILPISLSSLVATVRAPVTQSPFTTKLTVTPSQLSLVFAATILWNHVRHPLYRFPGPFLASWSNVLHSYWFLGGRQPYKILALHEKYGPVVRTSPNELSFASAGSWRDIYGFRQGHKSFVKSSFYDGGSFADRAHSIVSERDPVLHGQMRRDLAHAFSDRSLKEQEGLVAEAVDLFIQQLGVHASGPDGTDLVKWFNLTTFDIIGSLAFGESFGGLTSGRYC